MVVTRWSTSVIKVSRQMRSFACKGRVAFSFTVMVLAFLLLLKGFITKALKVLNFKIENNLYTLLCIS